MRDGSASIPISAGCGRETTNERPNATVKKAIAGAAKERTDIECIHLKQVRANGADETGVPPARRKTAPGMSCEAGRKRKE
jgi:hypothetical protein